jgi:hypothetical protein
VGRPLWREVVSVLFSFCRASPAQPFSYLSPTGLMGIFYCLYFWDCPNLEGQVPVFISSRNREGPTPRRTALHCVIALQIADTSCRQRGRPTWKNKKVIVTQRNVTSGHPLQKGHSPRPTSRLTVGRLNLNSLDVLVDQVLMSGHSVTRFRQET